MRRMVTLIIVLVGMAVFSSGCEWLGRMTVKAEKGIEKGAQKMEHAIEKMESEFEKGRKDGNKDE